MHHASTTSNSNVNCSLSTPSDQKVSLVHEPHSVQSNDTSEQSFIQATTIASGSLGTNPSSQGEASSSLSANSPDRILQPISSCQMVRNFIQKITSHVSFKRLLRNRVGQDEMEESNIVSPPTMLHEPQETAPHPVNNSKRKDAPAISPPQPIIQSHFGSQGSGRMDLDGLDDFEPLTRTQSRRNAKRVRFTDIGDEDESSEDKKVESNREETQILNSLAKERSEEVSKFFAQSYRDKGKSRLIEEYFEPPPLSPEDIENHSGPISIVEKISKRLPPFVRPKSVKDTNDGETSPEPAIVPPPSPRPRHLQLNEAQRTNSLFDSNDTISTDTTEGT
jgi:hypothetical protein